VPFLLPNGMVIFQSRFYFPSCQEGCQRYEILSWMINMVSLTGWLPDKMNNHAKGFARQQGQRE